MRRPSVVTTVIAGAIAVALGGAAVAAARAVPDEPSPAFVPHYVEELQESPPPDSSAALIGAHDEPHETVPPEAETDSTATTIDDHGGRRGRGRGGSDDRTSDDGDSGHSGSGSSSSGKGSDDD